MTRTHRAWLGLRLSCALLFGVGCRSAPQAALPLGALSVRVVPEAATVLIDDFPIARGSGTRNVRVPVGKHRMEARAPGYFSVYREFAIQSAQDAVSIEVLLRADPNAESESAPSPADKLPTGPTNPRLPELP